MTTAPRKPEFWVRASAPTVLGRVMKDPSAQNSHPEPREENGGSFVPRHRLPSRMPIQRAETKQVEITGKVSKVIYSSNDGSFNVYALKANNGENVKITSKCAITAKQGDQISVKGEWKTYKGQPSFVAVMLMHNIPKGARGFITWIKTGAVPGVGAKTAERIAKHFGDKITQVVEEPEELMKAGIPRARAEAISDAWISNASQPELVEFLGNFGIGEMTIAKIVKRYGGASRRIVKDNPWQLAEDIQGIGFPTADAIAVEAGQDMRSEKRILAGINFAMKQAVERDGHCGLPREGLLSAASQLLSLETDNIAEHFEKAVNGNKLIFDEITSLVCPVMMLRNEEELADKILQIMEEGDIIAEEDARDAVERTVTKLGVQRDEGQMEAAVQAVMNPVFIITGGPGTGKSTTQKIIVNALESLGRKKILAAPTGRAAKRLSEVTEKPAGTCHRLLQYDGETGGFIHGIGNHFDEDRVIVDEFSMVDLNLGKSFFDAIKPQGGITIVGDVDQLPSVRGGQVLRDLIESGAVPYVRLKKVHRQVGDSGIITAATRIISGEMPVKPDETLKGFKFEPISNPDAIRSRVVDLVTEILPKHGFDPMNDVQVLAAMRVGDLGIEALNAQIKARLNPATNKNSVTIKGRTFSTGDRVIHVRNDYEKNVFNGEVGKVTFTGTAADKNGAKKPIVKVDYSGFEAWYDGDTIDDIELSYALTVHKSQGCEFPAVVMVCPFSHRNMLGRNLVFTGVTRAKKVCVMVGDRDAVAGAVSKTGMTDRYTTLKTQFSEERD
ncbi:ATP-dependent RecD-like DNA helicase [Roseibium sp. RKSG952]|nr:ATP-dependent RecD-like DNA helicase [Roseibium sp. RKSG952]